MKRDDLEAALQIILAKHDPESLISIGAPPDEYMPEAKKIAAEMTAESTLEQVESIVANVFRAQFDTIHFLRTDADSREWQVGASREIAAPAGRTAIVQAIARDAHSLILNG